MGLATEVEFGDAESGFAFGESSDWNLVLIHFHSAGGAHPNGVRVRGVGQLSIGPISAACETGAHQNREGSIYGKKIVAESAPVGPEEDGQLVAGGSSPGVGDRLRDHRVGRGLPLTEEDSGVELSPVVNDLTEMPALVAFSHCEASGQGVGLIVARKTDGDETPRFLSFSPG